MADKVVYKTADEARAAALASSAKYAAVTPNVTPSNAWASDPNNPYVQFLQSASDPTNGPIAFNKLYSQLVKMPAPAGSKLNNMFEVLQSQLRSNKFSSGKTPLGVPDPKDITGLTDALKGAIQGGASDVFTYLGAITAYGGRGGTTVKKVDTTPRYSAQIQRALTFKDYGDAKNAFVSSYFTEWGVAPSEQLITNFQKAWNKELEAQTPSTTSEFKVTMTPVYTNTPVYDKSKPVLTASGKPKKDAKGKIIYQQKVDKDGKPVFEIKKDASGQPVYKTTTTSTTKTGGEGWTESEQQNWLADFMVTNYPDAKFNPEEIGGAAKVIYNELIRTHKDNFDTVPTFAELAPVIKDVLKTGDAKVGTEILSQYQAKVRAKAAKRFMSYGNDINAGEDAAKFIKPIIEKVSTTLERSFSIDDPFIKQILNFKDANGEFRQPNDYELDQLLKSHPDMIKTSTAKNEAVNMFQAFKSGIGR